MNKEQKFYVCKHCGNLVGMIESSGAIMVCCGDPMNELVANTTDASEEKHVPVAEVSDGLVEVTIGSVLHPMTEEHHISWIYLQTTQGGQRKGLKVDGAPSASFALTEGDVPVAVFEYCNLHGLWKLDL